MNYLYINIAIKIEILFVRFVVYAAYLDIFSNSYSSSVKFMKQGRALINRKTSRNNSVS